MPAPFYDMVDLSNHEVTVNGLKVVAVGPELATWLSTAWTFVYDSPEECIAARLADVLAHAEDTAQEGEPKGWLFQVKLGITGPGFDTGVKVIWAERISNTEATAFFPSER